MSPFSVPPTTVSCISNVNVTKAMPAGVDSGGEGGGRSWGLDNPPSASMTMMTSFRKK